MTAPQHLQLVFEVEVAARHHVGSVGVVGEKVLLELVMTSLSDLCAGELARVAWPQTYILAFVPFVRRQLPCTALLLPMSCCNQAGTTLLQLRGDSSSPCTDL
jgi:hypothetical protein